MAEQPKQRKRNGGVRKGCGCPRRAWTKCEHPWFFNFKWNGVLGGVDCRVSLERKIGRLLRRETKKGQAVYVRDMTSLGDAITTKTAAEAMADDLRARIRNREFEPKVDGPVLQQLTLSQLLATYDRDFIVVNRPLTAKDAACQIRKIERVELMRPDGVTQKFGEWWVSDVTTHTIEQFRTARKQRGTFAANRDLQLLRACFNWAIRMKLMRESPFKIGTETAVKLDKEPKRSRRLDGDESDWLLAAAKPHLRAVIEAALEAAMRRSEITSLQWADVVGMKLEEQHNGTVKVGWAPRAELFLKAVKTKTKTDRHIPISTRLRTILEMRRLDPKGKPLAADAYVFGNAIGERVVDFKRAWYAAVLKAHGHEPKYVRKAGKGAGPLTAECRAQLHAINLHFHDLRRECASRWHEGAVPLDTIKDWLGHTSIAQTSTYLAGTLKGQHDAMRAFDERRGALQPPATPSRTDCTETRSTALNRDSETRETLEKPALH